ncbi:MAG TPA: family 10 glycosylhydrolase [Trichocoleus sp.]|jgi:uncharacterized lipoprotein YddW (UPF0748 family)
MKRVRGVWLTNVASDVYEFKDSINQAIELLAKTGFNVVFPVVWNKGHTLYESDVMERHFGPGFKIDPAHQATGRDPLAEIVEAAKKYKLKVIPWFEYGFAASAVQKTAAGGLREFGEHILQKKPNFAAVDHTGKPLIKPHPKNVGDIGFKWMNALNPEVQAFMIELIVEVVQKYDVDGIQGDDRLPAFPVEGFDQDAATRFAPSGAKPTATNTKWMEFRADILTKFLKELCDQVRQVGTSKGKKLLISMAPHPRGFGFREYLQDTKAWLDLIDMMHPQLYRRTPDDLHDASGRLITNGYINLANLELQGLRADQVAKISPGILMKEGDDYRISNTYLDKAVKHNRTKKLAGEVFFFFEGLRKPNDSTAKILRDPLYSVIKLDDEGPDVVKLQKLLKNLSKPEFDPGEPDGIFGTKTEEAVKAYQKSQFPSSPSDIDGKVGGRTLAKLGFASLNAFGEKLDLLD